MPWRAGQGARALATREGQERFLLASLATAAAETGLQLSEHEVYDFKTPPILGGAQQPDNLSVMDFKVALNLCGQIHGQVRNLPAGTPIGEIKITPLRAGGSPARVFRNASRRAWRSR